MGKMKNRLLIAAVGIVLLGAKTYRPVLAVRAAAEFDGQTAYAEHICLGEL